MKPISSVYGRIETLLVTMPGNVRECTGSRIAKEFGGIIQSFSPGVNILVLCNHTRKAQQEINELYPEATIRLIPIDHRGYLAGKFVDSPESRVWFQTKWAQDPFLILSGACGPVILEPYEGRTPGDHWIAEMVSAHTDAVIKSTPLYLEGGNILVGDKYALIGADLLFKNLPDGIDTLANRAEVLDRFALAMGIEKVACPMLPAKHTGYDGVVSGGKSFFQPLYHIDLYVTLAGRNSKGEEVVLVSHLFDRILEATGMMDPVLKELGRNLEETAKWFEEEAPVQTGRRFHVRRIPLVPVRGTRDGGPFYSFLSFANCHIEVYEGVRKVYLPKYHIGESHLYDPKSPEYETHGVFDALRFEVKWVDNDFYESSKGLGALHCMSNVLQREMY